MDGGPLSSQVKRVPTLGDQWTVEFSFLCFSMKSFVFLRFLSKKGTKVSFWLILEDKVFQPSALHQANNCHPDC